jgi:molybdate transport system substrate-binding protein
MTKHLAPQFAATMLAGLLFSTAAIDVAVAEPVEITVLTSVALTSALDELAVKFERATGNKLKIGYDLIANVRKRIIAGETADVIMLSRPAMEDLSKQDKFASGSVTDIAGTPVAIGVQAGAPKPDISSPEALKKTLLAAKSIVYSDPAKGGASGVYFAKVVEQLGLTEELKARTILVPGAQAGEVLARKEAEIGVAQASEIVPVAGAQLVGPLPGEFASMTNFTAAVGAGSKQAEAAKSLIQYLTGPDAAPVLKAKGFQPAKSGS